MKSYIIIVLCSLLALISLSFAAPLEQRIERDPELTAGFFEGDIVLDKQRNGLRNETKRWPNNIVYYKFHEGSFDAEHHNHIMRGMAIIEEKSCIRFKEATAETTSYVNITGMDGGCYSSVGFLNGIQNYNLQIYPLDTGCFRMGTIVHEFLHTLGFFHMQSASNRDDYVRIVEENIIPNTLSNFNKYNTDYVDDYDEVYDYGSVLHYSAYAFSQNGKITIEPLRDLEVSTKIMGQRRGMSQSDINKLNSMYKCPLEVKKEIEFGMLWM